MYVTIMKAREVFQIYQRFLNKRPYLVHAIQSGTLMGAGDLISQTWIENKSFKDADYSRTIKFSAIGFCIGGPALRVWYGILNRHVGSSGKTVALKKVFIDQAVFAPTFLFVLLVSLGALQGKSRDSIKNDIKANYFDILKSNYYIWPWVQVVNFYFVPLQYQVLLVQSVALLWNTYLSHKINKKKELK